jgi:hypothetical protein
VRFRARVQGTWSAESNVPTPTFTGAPIWLELVRRPGTDEITLAYATAAADLHVVTWTGAAWDTATAQTLEAELNTIDFQSFAVAYESTSGDLVAIWGRDQPGGSPYVTPWALRSAGTKQFGGVQTIAATPAASMHADSEPGSNRIAFVWNEDTCGAAECDDFVAAVWNGSAFVNVTILDPDIGPGHKSRAGTRPVAVAWRNGEAIATYASTNPVVDNLRWVKWTSAGWSAVMTATMSPGLGDQTVFLPTRVSTSTNLGLVVASTTGIFARGYDGSAWANAGLGPSLFAGGVTSGVPLGVITR